MGHYLYQRSCDCYHGACITLALLRRSERDGFVPVEMFSQIVMTRCLGVARSAGAQAWFRPSEICQRYLVDALEHVPPMFPL
jgi:hypothetical protein